MPRRIPRWPELPGKPFPHIMSVRIEVADLPGPFVNDLCFGHCLAPLVACQLSSHSIAVKRDSSWKVAMLQESYLSSKQGWGGGWGGGRRGDLAHKLLAIFGVEGSTVFSCTSFIDLCLPRAGRLPSCRPVSLSKGGMRCPLCKAVPS